MGNLIRRRLQRADSTVHIFWVYKIKQIHEERLIDVSQREIIINETQAILLGKEFDRLLSIHVVSTKLNTFMYTN